MIELHRSAETGFSKAADAYVAGRPDYPAALVGWLKKTLDLAPGKTVLEIGAGTGKFLPTLLATGANVIALEPLAEMRSRLAAAFPAVVAVDGAAEAIPLPDASVDAAVCATAFHWFANRTALDEIVRVVRPGGYLGLVWNVRDETVPWVAELTEIMAPYVGDTPRHAKEGWKAVFPHPGLGDLVRTDFTHVHEGPAERVIVDRIMSVSFIAALDDENRAKVAAAVRAVVAGHPELSSGPVRFPYRTVAYAARRR